MDQRRTRYGGNHRSSHHPLGPDPQQLGLSHSMDDYQTVEARGMDGQLIDLATEC